MMSAYECTPNVGMSESRDNNRGGEDIKKAIKYLFFQMEKERGEPLEHATKRVANVNNGIYRYDTSSSRIE